MSEGGQVERPTMSMEDAAVRVGMNQISVQRWFDRNEAAGTPVGERERDALGVPVPGSHRRPYRDAVEEWRSRRRGAGVAVPVSPAAPGG